MSAATALQRVALIVMVSMLATGCLTDSQSDADHEAAIFADKLLAPRLDRELKKFRGDSAQRRVQVIHSWLTAPDTDFTDSLSTARWVAGAPEGSAIPVAVYVLWDDTTFVEDRRWGRVCRQYDVDTTVTSRVVTCPENTPREPPSDSVGAELR